jgi:hypothetical protein
MKKINSSNQQMLDSALAFGINLNGVRKRCTLKFAVNLFRYVLKETQKASKEKPRKGRSASIDMIFPVKRFENIQDYFDLLEESGFRLKKYYEDFVDEDTGKVVSIKRHKFKLLV